MRISDQLCWPEEKLPQKERMKYTHTIHPYFGKFVPQLARHFIERDLRKCKMICDPFMGSGTTLIESNIAGIPSIGLDISKFNVLMCGVKTKKYNTRKLRTEVMDIFNKTGSLLGKTSLHNYIGTKQHRRIYKTKSPYLNKWFHPEALHTLLVFKDLISKYSYAEVLQLILTRTARSSRMIAHYEVDYPKKPYPRKYYCEKHRRICHPTKDAYGFLKRYCRNTVDKIEEFQNVRNDVHTYVRHADSRKFDFNGLRIDGVFTSPPYLGLIDYHEQHRYAYELLGIPDNSSKEIGPRSAGQSQAAKATYMKSMTDVLRNVTSYSFDRKKGKFILVVHDKLGLYQNIVEDAGMRIVRTYYRKVERRSGRRAGGFTENVFVCKVDRNA